MKMLIFENLFNFFFQCDLSLNMYVPGLNWDIKLNILMEAYNFKRKSKELLLPKSKTCKIVFWCCFKKIIPKYYNTKRNLYDD